MEKKRKKRVCRLLLLLALLPVQTGCVTQASDRVSLEEPGGTETEDAHGETQQEAAESTETESTETESTEVLSVYVCGAVCTPGVYELPAGSRLYQAVEAAGGMAEGADPDYLNLAEPLSDGTKIRIPTREEVESGQAEAGVSSSAGSNGQAEADSGTEGRININTADESQLMTLTGIGEAKAKSILAYRQEQGAFEKIEDIMNISGIKETVFEKIKDRICVE